MELLIKAQACFVIGAKIAVFLDEESPDVIKYRDMGNALLAQIPPTAYNHVDNGEKVLVVWHDRLYYYRFQNGGWFGYKSESDSNRLKGF